MARKGKACAEEQFSFYFETAVVLCHCASTQAAYSGADIGIHTNITINTLNKL